MRLAGERDQRSRSVRLWCDRHTCAALPSVNHYAMTNRLRALAVLLPSAAILGATTFPTTATDLGRLSSCIVCGDRGAADAILNVALFATLGIGLAISGARIRIIALLAFLLSSSIETAQLLFIPGRDPSVGDVLFNLLGALLGARLAHSARWMLAARGSAASVLAATWAFVVAVILLGGAALLAPAFPDSTYFASWTPEVRRFQPYDGRVLEARIAETTLRPGRLAEASAVRRALLMGAPLTIRFMAGDRPSSTAPLVTINDSRYRRVLLVGIDRDDLVLRHHTVGESLRFDRADVRASEALHSVRAGDLVLLTIRREAGAYCFDVNGDEVCVREVRSARGWSTLLFPDDARPWVLWLLDALWMSVLAAPLGFWITRSGRGPVTAMLVMAVLLWIPSLPPMRAIHALDAVLPLAGLVGGIHLANRSRGRARRPRERQLASAPVAAHSPPSAE